LAFFTFRCDTHGDFKLSLDRRIVSSNCPTCGSLSKNILKPGKVQVNERLDNGLMARAVERPVNIEEMISERANNDPERKRASDAGPKD
jgi:NAD-dependent SIR2 family protein deacetylase